MTKTYIATIHDTSVRKLTIEAHSEDHAMAQACSIIEYEHDWRADAELLAGGCVTVHNVEEDDPGESHPPQPYRVSFTEEAAYALTVYAHTAEQAKSMAEQALKEGSSDSFEETANLRSPFTIEEMCS
jgi:hypothetical protein